MKKVLKMGKHVWITKDEIDPDCLAQEFIVNGIRFEINLPWSDTPEIVEGNYLPQKGEFEIVFKYPNDFPEPFVQVDNIDGTFFFEGKITGHLKRILVPVLKEDIAVIEVETTSDSPLGNRLPKKMKKADHERRSNNELNRNRKIQEKSRQLVTTISEAIQKRRSNLPDELTYMAKGMNLDVASDLLRSDDVGELIGDILRFSK
ncbi:MAG: hypothetical protein CME31_21700 [Gimesia sp.]|uniref:Uncharacterized protein n=1 Tax=Gimesia maris TaxID=122 RepID=A0A3D3RAN8_9PLAN|nr:hypothetical protein [Gimesia sp.]HCO24670.1 hypothetical protein [Gimesia maris]